MGWSETSAARQTWANVDVTLKFAHAFARKCDVWGVLFTSPVGCSTLLSGFDCYNKKRINLSKCHSEQLSEKAASTGRFVLWCRSCHDLRGTWLWWVLWAPPVVIPLPPWCAGWRRRRMPFLILPERKRCKSLIFRLTVKTVHLCSCFAEVWSEFHRCISSRCVERERPGLLISLIFFGR